MKDWSNNRTALFSLQAQGNTTLFLKNGAEDMATTSFIDNNYRYIKSFISRDYRTLAEEIKKEKEELSHYIEEEDLLAGYKIMKNMPLSSLYGFDCYVVRFYFANVSTLHNRQQSSIFATLLQHLKAEIMQTGGYYNLRVPTHMVDLVKALNTAFDKILLCGGTVEEFIYQTQVPDHNKNQLRIFEADHNYLLKYKDILFDMTYTSFATYQGQYHISDVTEYQAGKIYENWIKNSLSGESKDQAIVAEYEDQPIGFVTIGEDDFAVEGILSAVSGEKRQLGAYKAMISYIINYAYSREKAFITSTQFDNFIVQGTWNSLGLRPFYSIYNIHLDYRTK